jgi:alkylation response protein AidB-like acyl-CoA dehydrogenase
MADIETFRRELAAWLEANCPPEMRKPFAGEHEFFWGGEPFLPGQKEWLERCVAKGYTAPTWPKEYGGAGLSDEEGKVFWEEMVRLSCRPPILGVFGLGMIGPVLLRYGSDAQKKKHLPGIVQGTTRWCQGYSEPGYGSDLAGLQTRAVRDGDHYIVDGQKVWTSYANKADWLFCLVRTNPTAPKHLGISMLLIDMRLPGVSTRPIKLLSGGSPFCETFLDQVRVPASELVGVENAGWEIAKYLLTHERSTIAAQNERVKIAGYEAALEDIARAYLDAPEGPLPDESLRLEIARVAMDQRAHELTNERVMDSAQHGRGPGDEASILKYYYAELNKRRQDLRVRVMGLAGCGWEDPAHFSESELLTTTTWLRSRANSIEGGTAEIQLNVIAKRVLGLPD